MSTKQINHWIKKAYDCISNFENRIEFKIFHKYNGDFLKFQLCNQHTNTLSFKRLPTQRLNKIAVKRHFNRNFSIKFKTSSITIQVRLTQRNFNKTNILRSRPTRTWIKAVSFRNGGSFVLFKLSTKPSSRQLKLASAASQWGRGFFTIKNTCSYNFPDPMLSI